MGTVHALKNDDESNYLKTIIFFLALAVASTNPSVVVHPTGAVEPQPADAAVEVPGAGEASSPLHRVKTLTRSLTPTSRPAKKKSFNSTTNFTENHKFWMSIKLRRLVFTPRLLILLKSLTTRT